MTCGSAGRSMGQGDMEVIIKHLEADPVVEAVFDAKSEEIGPGIFRFKAEIGTAAVISSHNLHD